MKEKYEIPEMKTVLLAAESIMTISGEAAGRDDKTGIWNE